MGFSMFYMLASLVILAGVSAVKMRPPHTPPAIFGRPFGGFMGEAPEVDSRAVNVTEAKCTQKVDHFDANNQETWQQYYQYNPSFYNKSGIAFLMLGGEGSIGKGWITADVQWIKWAREHGAAAFQAEHRFYGRSRPKPTMDVKYISKYFTIDQALADFKSFIEQMNKKYFPDVPKMKWVTFGGSYPGSLSAWLRQKYPELSVGAVSSSSAVNTLAHYWGYAENMRHTYGSVSQQCADNIEKAFAKIQQMVYSPVQRAILKDKLQLCESFVMPIQTRDIQFFLSNVFTTFQTINQYTGDNMGKHKHGMVDVENACRHMTNANITDPVLQLRAVQDFYNSYYPTEKGCNPNNYTAYMEMLANTTYANDGSEDAAASRGWTWQTCTELGYFQTTDGGSPMFGSTVPMDFYVDQCKQLFGDKYDADYTYAATKRSREKYGGGNNYKGTNCVFPNGSWDPWLSLGYAKNDTANNVIAFTIDKTAHCADMYVSNSTHDLPSLVHARQFMGKQIELYIKTG